MTIRSEKSDETPLVHLHCAGPRLRILQMTDLHYHDFLPDRWKELLAFRDLMRTEAPDLLVNTGDFFQQSDLRMATTVCTWFDRLLAARCPWCLALGNHDQDADVPDPEARLLAIEEMLSALPSSLFRRSHRYMQALPGPDYEAELEAALKRGDCKIPLREGRPAWDGFLGGNYALLVEHGQSLAWEIFVLNSRSYLHVPGKVRGWMKGLHTPGCPAVVFLHVPPRAYAALIETGGYLGQAAEKVCFEAEDGSFHRFLIEEMRDVVACFAGHDHVNDCAGLHDSVLYAYGRKSGTNAYGGYVNVPKPRDVERGKLIRMGATVIELDLTASSSREPLRASGPTWSYRGLSLRHLTMPPDLYLRDRSALTES